jgi:hypothetical protein
LHQLDSEVAAAEEHQPAPIGVRAVERHVETKPRAIERGGRLRIASGNHDVVEAEYRRVRHCGRKVARLRQLKKEQAHPPRQVGRGARALPAQPRTGAKIAALDVCDRFRLQRQPIEPAMHFFYIVDTEADAGKTLARLPDQFADVFGCRHMACRRHQLERHVGKREQHGLGALALAAPGGTAPEQ